MEMDNQQPSSSLNKEEKAQRPVERRTSQAIGGGNGLPLEIGWRYGLIS